MNVKRDSQNSLFLNLFSDEEKSNLVELYNSLHPEDKTITADDLKIVSIENVFTNDIYNDLGLLVRNKLIVLVEAQSTWNPNIVLRMFLYLAKTYQNYIFDDENLKAKLYSNKKIEVPIPELYVIYTGNMENVPSKISLRKDFFGNMDIGIELEVKVLYTNNEQGNIIEQYISFCRILQEQRNEYKGDIKKAIQKTIKVCISKNILKNYLELKKKEVEDYMYALLSEEEARQCYLTLAKEEMREELLAEGRAEGITEGGVKALYEIANKTPKEIASDLSISEAEVKSILDRIIKEK